MTVSESFEGGTRSGAFYPKSCEKGKKLLTFELGGGRVFTHLGVSLGAVERLELLGDGVELTDAGLVNEKVEEVGGEGVERSLLAELGEDVLLVLALVLARVPQASCPEGPLRVGLVQVVLVGRVERVA